MTTIFTTPRPFEGLYEVIQTNAFRSWQRLGCKVVVYADREREGDAAVEFAEALGFTVRGNLERSEGGKPLLSHLFPRAEREHNDVRCYVNADIILEDDLLPALEQVNEHFPGGFLAVARRWNVQVLSYLDFSPGWEGALKAKVDMQGSQMAECAIDLFAWAGKPWDVWPDFTIGSYKWDNWLVGRPHMTGCPVVDISPVVRITHQSHAQLAWDDPEAVRNHKIMAGPLCGLKDSTHTLTKKEGIKDGWHPET